MKNLLMSLICVDTMSLVAASPNLTGPQHGSFMRLTKFEYKRLQAWSAKKMRAGRKQ